ncbi:MAG: DUF521 domain-containing protein, partial [Candidatus Aenigmarchaeota archaeon]|nr:DUF521 domain-containing protein [Candidatus Aenigmarchaeota archaeon]
RQAQVTVVANAKIDTLDDFSALGYAIGKKIENKIPYITGIKNANTDQLKIFSASIATYGGTALFYIEGITPKNTDIPEQKTEITDTDIKNAKKALNDNCAVDFVALGCPHASIEELKEIADILKGKTVKIATWISTARAIKKEAEKLGILKTIEDSGAIVAADTCMAVAPLKGRFTCMATNSAKACFYAHGSNNFKTKLGSTKQCIDCAVDGKWN